MYVCACERERERESILNLWVTGDLKPEIASEDTVGYRLSFCGGTDDYCGDERQNEGH